MELYGNAAEGIDIFPVCEIGQQVGGGMDEFRRLLESDDVWGIVDPVVIVIAGETVFAVEPDAGNAAGGKGKLIGVGARVSIFHIINIMFVETLS